MKLINYNYGYNNTFDCSIHGKIIVNKTEWARIIKYLLNPSVKIINWDEQKNMLKEDIKKIIYTKQGTLLNIRTSATKKVVERFKIKGYKLNNYAFLITY